MSRFRRIPFHPILFGVYAILALLAHNISQVSINIAIRSLVIVSLTTLIALFLTRLVVKDWHRAAIIVSIMVVFFFSYGHLYSIFEGVTILGFVIGRHRFLLLMWLVIFLLGSWWAIKSNDKRLVITYVLNIIAVVAIIFPIFQITNYRLDASISFQKDEKDLNSGWEYQDIADLQMPDGEIPPDIYYIILDMYLRDDVLMEVFHYDNSPFLNDLIEEGFFVARCSQSNYTNTVLSLASSLNLNYLESFAQELIDKELNKYHLEPFVDGSIVRRELSNLGYTIVNVESGFFLTEWKDADVYLQRQKEPILQSLAIGSLNEFESMLLSSTVVILLNDVRVLRSPALIPIFDQLYIERRNNVLYALDNLDTIATSPGSKFVFVHIIIPHPPFVFGPNGEYFPRTTPLTLAPNIEDWDWERYIEGYKGQVAFLNDRILVAIQNILAKSTTPPIIILQSDHGITRLRTDREQVAILNTYYLPNGGEQNLYHTITPVNTFRLIFNTYFNSSFTLLDDISYVLEEGKKPYNFHVVPNTRKDCDEW